MKRKSYQRSGYFTKVNKAFKAAILLSLWNGYLQRDNDDIFEWTIEMEEENLLYEDSDEPTTKGFALIKTVLGVKCLK